MIFERNLKQRIKIGFVGGLQAGTIAALIFTLFASMYVLISEENLLVGLYFFTVSGIFSLAFSVMVSVPITILVLSLFKDISQKFHLFAAELGFSIGLAYPIFLLISYIDNGDGNLMEILVAVIGCGIGGAIGGWKGGIYIKSNL